MKFHMKIFSFLACAVFICKPVHARYVTTDGTDVDNADNKGGPAPQRVMIKFKNSQGRAAATAAASKVHFDFDDMNVIAATVPAQAMMGLEKNQNIEYIEPDAARRPAHLRAGVNSFLNNQRRLAEMSPYGIEMVQANQVNFDTTSGITVCVIDSGYQINHPDLPQAPDVTGYDNINLPWATDGCGHGSHVAGTIAAVDNDVGVIGVAPGVSLYIVRVFDDGCAWTYSSNLVDAAKRCRDGGANIINMSLGGGRGSKTEERAFRTLWQNGILSIAAAGNDGNTRYSYPASYASVVSVAAIDEAKVVAGFSQQNSQVELAAPGVLVQSTVLNSAGGFAEADGSTYGSIPIALAALGDRTNLLVDCGLGESDCDASGGKICLISRGNISFRNKVDACENGGGSATIIYNNVPGLFQGTLGSGSSENPAIGISQADGQALLANSIGMDTRVFVGPSDYDYYDGTSMASPHVAGVAALVWSQHPECSAEQIRSALQVSTKDLGQAGRDNTYGYGLVQAKAAVDHLTANGCGGGGGGGGGGCGAVGDSCVEGGECCSGSCKGKTGAKTCK